MTTTKYACDIIAPTKILDRDTGETVVIDTIEVIPNTDMLIFFGYFEEDGSPWERQLDWDSKVRVAEDA